MTTIHFVRHGHVHNPHEILYGRLPRYHLSHDGLLQAQSAAQVLSKYPLAAVFSSPMLRARQTAQMILRYHPELKLRTSKHIQEVMMPFEGQHIPSLGEDWQFYKHTTPPYETPQDIFERIQKFAKLVRQNYAGQAVVAVTHGDIVCFAILWAARKPITGESKRFIAENGIGYPATASITSLTFQTDKADEVPSYGYQVPY